VIYQNRIISLFKTRARVWLYLVWKLPFGSTPAPCHFHPDDRSRSKRASSAGLTLPVQLAALGKHQGKTVSGRLKQSYSWGASRPLTQPRARGCCWHRGSNNKPGKQLQ